MSGLDWLAQAEELGLKGRLSDDAVTLAVILEPGFEQDGRRGRLRRLRAGDHTGWTQWQRYILAERELRDAGLLAGRGIKGRPYRYHFPAVEVSA